MSTTLLAIDTATEACSAALWIDGSVTARHVHAPNRHSELLLPMIEEVLAAGGATVAELNAVAWGRGPGAFTGLRIGAAIAQGVAFGRGIPVVPVSTLQAMAQRHCAPQVVAAIDARMDQVYWACYRNEGGLMTVIGRERLTLPREVALPKSGDWLAVGSGWDRYGRQMGAAQAQGAVRHVPHCHPRATEIAHIAASIYAQGGAVPAERAQPSYLRHRVVGP